ncbi:MAG: SEC-C metal-binding domain-containing protein [Candidatus Competibacteraceae bacterium]
MDKIGRNDPCPCGSGKKYKKCCLGRETPAKAPRVGTERVRTHVTSPPDSRPTPLAGMTPYVIAKLFEDSEVFAQMQRLEPEKARGFWTPRKVAALGTETILAQLRALAVDVSREDYLALAAGQTSAWAISQHWREAIAKPLSRHADDFLGLAACELWKRYCPDRPSIEMLDDQMQQGYRLVREGQGTRTCELWWAIWQTICSRLRPEMSTTWQAAAVFDGSQCLFNWVQDFAIELHNAALAEPRYAKIGVQLCEDVLAHFSGEDDLFLKNFCADLGEFHFLAGAQAEGERVLLALIRDYPDCAAGYVRLADLLGYGHAPDRKPIDRERARELLEQALARPVADAANYDLEKRLAELQKQTCQSPEGSTSVASHQPA